MRIPTQMVADTRKMQWYRPLRGHSNYARNTSGSQGKDHQEGDADENQQSRSILNGVLSHVFRRILVGVQGVFQALARHPPPKIRTKAASQDKYPRPVCASLSANRPSFVQTKRSSRPVRVRPPEI